MYEQIMHTLIRGTAAYLFALLLTRLIGRKLISQMTYFDFVVGVSLGSLVANISMGPQNNTTTASTALFVLSLLVIITDFAHIKSLIVRKIVNSEPVTLIDKGNIVEDNMRRTRLTIGELTMKLREKNIFNLSDVEFAIMETDGQLSVLPKPEKTPLTPSHINLKAISTGLMRDIIIDGNIMDENLESVSLDTQWLQSQLNSKGIQSPSDVFYAGVDNFKNIYISVKNKDNEESHGKYGIE
jgi:uncharacterized membrane protein YcaP (DUF421 family)